VIRLGLRLSVRGGEAVARLVLIAAAVAVGVAVLLAVLADFHAFQVTTGRACWECTQGEPATSPAVPDRAELWRYSEDYFRGRPIIRLDVAAPSPGAPVIPGLTAMPAAGEYAVSPALADLLGSTPGDQLGDRFPGGQSALIGTAALSGPDALVVVIGRTPGELAATRTSLVVTQIASTPEPLGTTTMYRFGFGLAAIALTLPLMIFIGTATRLAAARREERYAAMRLVGSTVRQTNAVASVDVAVAAVLGTVAGLVAFAALRPVVAAVPVTGTRFFADDVTPTALGYAVVGVGVPVVAVAAALWSLRRVRVSPLGVSRRVTPPAPSAWRIVPLLAGVGLFVGGVVAESTGPSESIVYPGLILVLLGLVIAGPWLTMQAARGLARLVHGPSALLAGRRLMDDPKAAFRTVSGLTMAVFIGTAIAVLLPGLLTRPETGGDPAVRNVLRIQYGEGDPNDGLSAQDSSTILRTLATYPGTTAVPLYLLPADQQPRRGPTAGPPPGPSDGPPPNSVVDCAQIARLPVFGRCAPGTTRVTLESSDLFTDNAAAVKLPVVGTASRPYAGSTDRLRLGTLLVRTDDPVTLERVRTYLTTHASITPPVTGPDGWSINALVPATFGEIAATRQAVYDALQRISFAAIVLTLLVAGCSLAVGTGGGILERKRPFTLLRLTGTPMSSLARVVLLESLLPLLAAAVVAAGTGWGLAATVATSLSDSAVPFPGWPYFATIGAGLAISIAVILLTLPLLRRLTRTQTARFE
jgi:hypothetical protein